MIISKVMQLRKKSERLNISVKTFQIRSFFFGNSYGHMLRKKTLEEITNGDFAKMAEGGISQVVNQPTNIKKRR